MDNSVAVEGKPSNRINHQGLDGVLSNQPNKQKISTRTKGINTGHLSYTPGKDVSAGYVCTNPLKSPMKVHHPSEFSVSPSNPQSEKSTYSWGNLHVDTMDRGTSCLDDVSNKFECSRENRPARFVAGVKKVHNKQYRPMCNSYSANEVSPGVHDAKGMMMMHIVKEDVKGCGGEQVDSSMLTNFNGNVTTTKQDDKKDLQNCKAVCKESHVMPDAESQFAKSHCCAVESRNVVSANEINWDGKSEEFHPNSMIYDGGRGKWWLPAREYESDKPWNISCSGQSPMSSEAESDCEETCGYPFEKEGTIKSCNVEKQHGARLPNPCTSIRVTYRDLLRTEEEQGSLADVNIIINNQIFRSHRLLLLMHSQMFRDVHCQQKIKYNTLIELKYISRSMFAAVLHWMYTKEIDLDVKNISKVESAAAGLGIDELLTMCQRLRQKLSR